MITAGVVAALVPRKRDGKSVRISLEGVICDPVRSTPPWMVKCCFGKWWMAEVRWMELGFIHSLEAVTSLTNNFILHTE